MSKATMYVRLFHGRKSANEQPEDWGTEGPVIGPVGVSWTYGNLKLHRINEDGIWDDMHEVEQEQDLIKCGGVLYGDAEVITHDDPLVQEYVKDGRVISFDQWKEQNGK